MAMEDSDSDYEPEYEIEQCIIGAKEDNSLHNERIKLKILSVIPPPLEFLSSLHSKQQEISGRQIWCGSILLSNYFLENHTILQGKNILELGCGTGILGMTVSSLFFNKSGDSTPKCVVMTDGDTEALKLLHKNINNNTIPRDITDATRLYWGNEEEYSLFCNNCTKKWPTLWKDDKHVMFNTIIAGDVLYKNELPLKFFLTVKRFLLPGGFLYLCHVPRATVTHDIVKNTAKKEGFCMDTVSVSNLDNIERNDCPMDDFERAVIYKLSYTED